LVGQQEGHPTFKISPATAIAKSLLLWTSQTWCGSGKWAGKQKLHVCA